MPCEWCGHEHARDALCTSRPKWSRRGFLSLFGAGVAGLAVAPQLAIAETTRVEVIAEVWKAGALSPHALDAILKAIYEPVIVAQLNRRDLWKVKQAVEAKGMTFRVHAR